MVKIMQIEFESTISRTAGAEVIRIPPDYQGKISRGQKILVTVRTVKMVPEDEKDIKGVSHETPNPAS